MISTREEFKKYVLTALGAPVVDINVTDEQIEDRIQDALDFWNLYHYDGSVHCFLKQIVTPSILKIKDNFDDVKNIRPNTNIIGLTSKATATVVSNTNNITTEAGQICCYNVDGNFIAGEEILVGYSFVDCRQSGKSKASINLDSSWKSYLQSRHKEYLLNVDSDVTNLSMEYQFKFTLKTTSDFFKIGIYDDRKFKVPDYVLGITRLLPANTATSSQNLFDAQYQLRLSDIYDLTSTRLIYYEQVMEHLDLLNFELSSSPYFEFNRLEGCVYPICKWGIDFNVGDYIIMEGYRLLNPAEAPRLWNEPWLKRYAIAKVKQQWGQNLSKFQGIQLPGGITFNGSEMLQSATQEIQELENELMNMLPPSAFMIG